MPSTSGRYSPPAQIFHWLTVLFVLAAWTLGTLGEDLPRGSIRHLGEFVHILLGETVVMLLVLRLFWRVVTPAPDADAAAGPMAARVAKAMHIVLYGLLLAVPVVGVVMLFHGGEALTVFGAFDLASPWMKNRELKHDWKEIHEFLANLLLALAALHAGAALVHHYVFRDRALKRMLPAVLAGD